MVESVDSFIFGVANCLGVISHTMNQSTHNLNSSSYSSCCGWATSIFPNPCLVVLFNAIIIFINVIWHHLSFKSLYLIIEFPRSISILISFVFGSTLYLHMCYLFPLYLLSNYIKIIILIVPLTISSTYYLLSRNSILYCLFY